MKKNFLIISIIISSLCMLSCSREDIATVNQDIDAQKSAFELVANIANTKTTLDDTYKVSWADDDIIYAVTTDGEWGKPYSEDNSASSVAEFTYSDSEKKFTTSATIVDGEHTFNFLYGRSEQKSYHRGASTSYKLSSSVSQDCSDPTAHLKDDDALYAQKTATTPVASISATMNHLFTLMRVNVTNNTGSDITLNSLTFTTDNNIAGVYTVNFADGSLAEKTSLSKKITITLSNGTIANKGILPVYFVMAPQTDYTGMIKMVVTDSESNTYTKQMTVSTAKSFEAGKFNVANCTLTTKDGVLDGSDAKLTSSEISSTLTTTYSEGTYTNKYGVWNYNSMKSTTRNNAIQINSGKYIGTPVLGTYIKKISLTLEESSTKTITILDELGTSEVMTQTLNGTEAEIDIESYHLNKVRITSNGAVYIKKITVSYSQDAVTPTKLNSPTITCESHSSKQLVFSWTPVYGATGYSVSWNNGTAEVITATTLTKSDLTADTEYTISVTAKGNGCGQTDSDAATLKQKTDAEGTADPIVLDFTKKTEGYNSYDKAWDYGDWTITYGQNNSKSWAYVKLGAKNSNLQNPCTIEYKNQVSGTVKKVNVHIPAGSLSKTGMSVTYWGLYVYSDAKMTTQYDYVEGGTIAKTEGSFDFSPSSGKDWTGRYYKVSWTLANTSSTNGIVFVDKITISF